MPNMQDPQPKILIVDDKTDNLLVLEVLLAPLDAHVIRANCGNEAVALTLEHDFALVLLDVQMPGMDGFEVAELLHSTEKTALLPIVFISAIYSGDYYKIKGVDVGAIDFIEKPIVPEILLGKVRLFLELYRSRRNLLTESFRNIVEQVSDGVMLIDRNGIILLLNPAAEKLFGSELKPLAGTLFEYPLFPGELQEISVTAEPGLVSEVELNVSSMRWHGDDVYIVSMRDVTERLKASRQLEATIKSLDASNAELRSFTYTVSHDLKSPLITIGGYAGLLEQTLGNSESSDVRCFIGEIMTATHKMSTLLDHLLTLSRVGKIENPFAPISLTSLVEEVALGMQMRLEMKQVELRIDQTLPFVMGDSVRLHQIIQNLLENAIKHMGDHAQPLVEIGIAETPSGKALFVRDNGVGILPQYHEKVFGLFQRLHNDNEGSGIGLALVKKIVELHGGKIWIESDGKGHGTTFWIQLPFSEEAPAG